MSLRINYWDNGSCLDHEEDQRENDKATRARLERASPKMINPRRNIVDQLNVMSRSYGAQQTPDGDLGVINKIRNAQHAQQKTGYRDTSDQQFEKLAVEKLAKEASFNRLHPGSLQRAPATRPRDDPDNAADERYVTPLTGTYERVKDAPGSLSSGDAKARDHWPSGETETIRAEFLLEAARILIEAVRARALRFPEGRRD